MFSKTQAEFSDTIYALLGRGKRHAALLYSQWAREGKIEPAAWAEPQALSLVEEILQHADLSVPEVSKTSGDGKTTKFLLRFADGLESETVIIPMESGTTLCVSSQVGCKRGCAFCETGRMGLLRNLTTREIVSQFFVAKHHFQAPVRNVVFMGMGEPFDNYDNVMQAVRVLTDPYGFGLGMSRITISTVGNVEAIRRFAKEADPALNLAVSVNAPTDEVRNRIMPVNRQHDMAELKKAMAAYLEHPRRQILAEYVLLKDVNDTLAHADALGEYLKELRVKINLIPYNEQANARFAPPGIGEQEAFMQRLRSHGFHVLLRHHKGRGIMAACGQLGNKAIRRVWKNGNIEQKSAFC